MSGFPPGCELRTWSAWTSRGASSRSTSLYSARTLNEGLEIRMPGKALMSMAGVRRFEPPAPASRRQLGISK